LFSDIEEYAFTPLTLQQATGSTTTNREFGDYDFLGDTFYGTFAGWATSTREASIQPG
jgi:hypothetical protein